MDSQYPNASYAHTGEDSPLSRSFVIDEEVPQTVPSVALHINIIHTACQPGLQRRWIPAEQPHHGTPAHGRKDRPGIVRYARRERR